MTAGIGTSIYCRCGYQKRKKKKREEKNKEKKRKGKERKGKERKGKERKGKKRKRRKTSLKVIKSNRTITPCFIKHFPSIAIFNIRKG